MATLSNFSPIVHRSMWGPNCSCEYTCHGQHGGASFHRKLTHPRLHVNMYQKLCSHQGTQLLGVLRHDTMWPATTVVTQLAVNVNHRLFAVPCLELTSFATPAHVIDFAVACFVLVTCRSGMWCSFSTIGRATAASRTSPTSTSTPAWASSVWPRSFRQAHPELYSWNISPENCVEFRRDGNKGTNSCGFVVFPDNRAHLPLNNHIGYHR